MSPAAKSEIRLRDVLMMRNSCLAEMEDARNRYNRARRDYENAETMLRQERDKYRDIVDTVHHQHK